MVARRTPAKPPVERRPLGYAALAGLGPATSKTDQGPAMPFRAAQPPPGVLPAGVVPMAMDDSLSDLYSYANTYGGGYGNPYSSGYAWMGYPALAQLAQQPEYRKIVGVLAQEMTRKWIRLHTSGGVDLTDKLRKLDEALKKFGVQDLFRRAAETDGYFGRAQIYIDTGVGDDTDLLKVPLIQDKRFLKRGGLRRLTLLEPIWTYPGAYNASDPLGRDFFHPTFWYVNSKQIHESRLLTLIGRPVPDLLKPSYAFGGLSLSQIAKPAIDNFLRTRQAVSDLIHSFSVSGIKVDMSSVLAGGSNEDIILRAEMFNRMRDNRGLMVLNKGSPNELPEEFFNVSTPLNGIDALQAQAQEMMASMPGIPLVKLFGITPSGLNASTDGEVRCFYDTVEALQEQLFTAPLKTIINFVQLSEFGEIDPSIDFSYEPLWSLDDAAKATIRKTNADAAIVMIDASIISPEEERIRIAAEDGGLYNGLDPADLPIPPPPPIDPNAPPPDLAGGEETPPSHVAPPPAATPAATVRVPPAAPVARP